MRVLFVGCVKQSEMFLQRLISDGVNVIGVITKSESKFNADFVDFGVLSREHDIYYIYAKNINLSEPENYIREKNPDIILCLVWSQLIKKEILAIPQKGCIGFHPAAIPHNRGRHPLIWALALGLERTTLLRCWNVTQLCSWKENTYKMADLKKRVIVVSPHSDDETLGAGGTIARLINEGNEVFWLNITSGKDNPVFSAESLERRARQEKEVERFYGFVGVYHLELPNTNLDLVGSFKGIRRGVECA